MSGISAALRRYLIAGRGGENMRLLILILALTCCLALAFGAADARTERSRAQVNAFLRQQGLARTPPGYEVDHIMPLCAGGKDSPENMQLLTKEQHKAKTRDDLRRCWKLRRGKGHGNLK